MQTQNLNREFGRYVTLNIFGMIGLSCYILADTFFIARGTGANGLAALNIAIPAYSVMHGTGLMIGVGGATRYSVCRAQGDGAAADRTFTHAVLLALLVSAVFLALGAFFSAPLARLLGANDAIFAMTRTYLQTLLCFGPFFVLNNVCVAFVRNDGAPGLAMFGMLFGSFANIVLDYLFIFPCGLGIFGAALATGASPILSMLVLSRHFKTPARGFHFRKTPVRPRLFGAICAPGLSSLVGELSTGFVLLLFNLVILRLAGNMGVAAYGIVANLSIVAISIFTGIAQGTQPLLSGCYGRGEQASLGLLVRRAAVLALLIASALYAVVFLFAGPLAAAFNSEGSAALTALAVPGLRIYFGGLWFCGVNIIAAAFFSAVGRPVWGFLLSLMRGLIVIVPVLLTLSYLFGMTGVWAVSPVMEGVTLLFTLSLLAAYFRKAA
ncbi:MATE family efflux transporter [Butyricicoccus faecihominis]|uniref:MATE family efflux transporter n=1 Tax=Butyricicoccus faecihominis TaxID=1712515 RepID=UPI002478FFCC|nr:MATE family efflux transporter [Butyricicoccus faecihominis]MCQ5131263.1 MATE family efflux transporter [Butyricicoccus faecihominis]